MSTQIVYYSGRGNSLQVSRELATRLEDASIAPFKEAVQSGLDPQVECLGLVFPVIDFGIPALVAGYLEAVLQGRSDSSYIFAVVLNGGMPAGSLGQVEAILRKHGRALAAGFLVDVRIAQGLQGDWSSLRGAILEMVSSRSHPPLPTASWFGRAVLTGLLNRLSEQEVHGKDRYFRVDPSCDGCRICAAVCPVENIALVGDKPVWGHACDQCFGCYAWCPRQAIHFKKDNQKLRDTNPNLRGEEFLPRESLVLPVFEEIQ
jgi:ferredoxin